MKGAWSIVVLLAVVSAPARADNATDAIIGTWRGSSVCVDRKAAPACNDETVVYDIAATAGKADTVTVKADKVVDGKRQPMGALDFTRGTDGGWTTEIQTPRVRALWRLTVDGRKMRGTMTLVPSKTIVRRMALDKD
jgi:hypothetical protein